MSAKKFCPKCKSENVAVDGASIEFSAGAMICKECGYRDTIFPEKEIKDKKSNK